MANPIFNVLIPVPESYDGSQSGRLSPCPGIFMCIRQAASVATPEELRRLIVDLQHALISIALVDASKQSGASIMASTEGEES